MTFFEINCNTIQTALTQPQSPQNGQMSFCLFSVLGLRQQFLGWKPPYQSGYVVIKNWIYYFYRCKPKSQPATATAKTTAPPPTFST